MNPERWQRLQRLFHDASELEAAEREEFLESECTDDPALRRQVESLILHDGSDDTALSEVVRDVAGSKSAGLSDADREGLIGPYRIERELGRGGMGQVFLAVRDDDQYRKRVAIKLMRGGIERPELLQRFRSERQILASLEHPHIARLLDGGATESGEPYVVMEYVEGEPIDVYCDRQRLTTEQRLRLFQDVCSAVQYAHSNLIVHRDIKPANILVTGHGEAKLLDFGIAKLLNPDMAPEVAAVTRTAMRLLTPEYGSPEQVRGETITTASDVYSLGVLLYEMLTGQRPYRLKTTHPGELEKVICEQEPDRPSTAVSRATGSPASGSGSESPHAARQADPKRLSRQLSGDLDNIVLMALRKEPSRRYASPAQFAEDIERHLGGEPVIARPATFGYRAQKFLYRNRYAVSVASIVLVVVVSLIGFYTSRLAHERDVAAAERDSANRERLKAERVSLFLTDMFEQANPYETNGADITAREILEKGALSIRTELHDEPEVRAEILGTIGWVNGRLGQRNEARALFLEQLEILESIHGTDAGELTGVLGRLGFEEYKLGNFKEAQDHLGRALDIQERKRPEDLLERAFLLNDYALVLREVNQRQRCQEMFREALAIKEEILGPDHEDVALALANAAVQLAMDGEVEEAGPMFRRALSIAEAVYGTDDIRLSLYLNNLAQFYSTTRDFDAALPLARRNLEVRERAFEPLHPKMAAAYINMSKVLENAGDMPGAMEYMRLALEVHEKNLGPESGPLAKSLTGYAVLLAKERQFEEAERVFLRSLAMKEKIYGPEHPTIAHTLNVLGEAYLQSKQYEKALPVVQRSALVWEKEYGPDHVRTASALRRLAQAHAWLGDFEAAKENILRVIATYDRYPDRSPRPLIQALNIYAAILDEIGEVDDAAQARARVDELKDNGG